MTGVDRRKVLQAMGVAGVGVTFGTTIARGDPATPFCEGCPSGTGVLAKYDWDDENDEFVPDGGACDVVEFDEVITDTDGEPTSVTFTSELLFEGLRVKTGNGPGDPCDSVPADAVLSNTEKTASGYTATVSIDDPEIEESDTISYIAFCAAVCFQVDFAFGKVVEDLGNDADDDGFYSGRKILHTFGSTYTEHTSGTQAVEGKTRNGCTVSADPINVDFTADEACVSFSIDEGSNCELTLAAYVAPCPLGFDPETADRQYLYDYHTETFDEGRDCGDPNPLAVELPTVDDLQSVCSEDGGTGVL